MRRGWLLYLVLIFALSSLPGNAMLNRPRVKWDKPVHFLLYSGLGWLYARRGGEARPGRGKDLLQCVLLVAAVGFCDELYQGLVPDRSQDVHDWFADLGGGFTGAAVALSRRREGESPEVKRAT